MLVACAKLLVKARKTVKYNTVSEYESVVDCVMPDIGDIFEFSGVISNEIDLAKKECLTNLVIVTMQKAFSIGQIRVINEKPQTHSIEYGHLEEKILWADNLELENDHASALVSASKVLCSMRKLVKENTSHSLAELCDLLKQFQETEIPAEIVEEVVATRDIYNNFKIVSSFESALRTGMAIGGIGSLDLGTIEVTQIDEAIELASGLKCTTARARSLFKAATYSSADSPCLKIYGLGEP